MRAAARDGGSLFIAIVLLSNTSESFSKVFTRSGSSVVSLFARNVPTSSAPSALLAAACAIRWARAGLPAARDALAASRQGQARRAGSSGGPSPRTRSGGTSRRRAASSTRAGRDAVQHEQRPAWSGPL
eukprot:2319280-Pyramimonas_sp.AAC.1